MSFCPRVISFYTVNTPYEKEAEKFVLSCERCGVSHHVEGVRLDASWHENTLYKPFFIAEKLDQFNEPLLWVDVDARFKQKPFFSFSNAWDIAIYTCPYQPKGDWRYNRTSSFLIHHSAQGRRLVNLWCERSKAPWIKHGDQEAMVEVLQEHSGFKLEPLPLGYVYIEDVDAKMCPVDLILQHYQASRYFSKEAPSHHFDSEMLTFMRKLVDQGADPEEVTGLMDVFDHWNL